MTIAETQDTALKKLMASNGMAMISAERKIGNPVAIELMRKLHPLELVVSNKTNLKIFFIHFFEIEKSNTIST
jgi:hypothetical protein